MSKDICQKAVTYILVPFAPQIIAKLTYNLIKHIILGNVTCNHQIIEHPWVMNKPQIATYTDFPRKPKKNFLIGWAIPIRNTYLGGFLLYRKQDDPDIWYYAVSIPVVILNFTVLNASFWQFLSFLTLRIFLISELILIFLYV